METETTEINYAGDPLEILKLINYEFKRELFSDATIYDKIYSYVKQHKNNDNIKITHLRMLFNEDKYVVFYRNGDIMENMEIPISDIIK